VVRGNRVLLDWTSPVLWYVTLNCDLSSMSLWTFSSFDPGLIKYVTTLCNYICRYFTIDFFHFHLYFYDFLLQCLQTVITPLDLFHMLLCYSLNLKALLNCDFYFIFSTGIQYTKYPKMSKWNITFWNFFKQINQK
jgi:hypothetical protein